ncbi:MAG: ferrous iron transport protein B [Synergistaceae bacterium]|nr:ferrous iron transport protein B [Synergistaceae bacterium]
MEYMNHNDLEMLDINKTNASDRIIALAGNPNVGKSTVFNTLTGMRQHTGNWPGKTVASAKGTHRFRDKDYILVDLPGTYSIMAHSMEEEIARDFILFGGADVTIVVCDATVMERNLNLVLQVIEITPKVVVCVNLLDEAKKKNIVIDLQALEKELGVPVVGTTARSGEGLTELIERTEAICAGEIKNTPRKIKYDAAVADAVAPLADILDQKLRGELCGTWLALRMLEEDESLFNEIQIHVKNHPLNDPDVRKAANEAREALKASDITVEKLKDIVVSRIVHTAEEIAASVTPRCKNCVGCGTCDFGSRNPTAIGGSRDRKLDRIFTSKLTGIPIMIALLCGAFWITIAGANYPSELLADFLFWFQDQLTELFMWLGAPDWVHGLLVLGVYRVLAWVVAVMLPPMAIFFPLFTLLEDFGYLPRVAFNLDHYFKKAKACGKQALTMCMGFGCNCAGVTGCRIIDSPREKLIAILTNNFVPCNGRFPTLIAIISMFFVGVGGGLVDSLLSAVILAGVIILGVFLTFKVSHFLSVTILKGEPSFFALELPPYRTPQIAQVLVRSIFDRTLIVLGRAVVVAAPAGLIIWVFANFFVGDVTLLKYCSSSLDKFARLLGMDGVILLSFILGFPANEIVFPIIIMSYLSTDSILEFDNLSDLKTLLVSNGWTWVTAVSTMLFCLCHWPCSTACLTIKQETGGYKWALLSIVIPTVIGIVLCFLFTTIVRLLGF